jgi:hypothetical protein
MRVTIELSEDDRRALFVHGGEVARTETGSPADAGSAAGAPAEATDGGSPSEALLAALGVGELDLEVDAVDGVTGDVVPDTESGYENADGTAGGAPPDWLANLLGGREQP